MVADAFSFKKAVQPGFTLIFSNNLVRFFKTKKHSP